MTSSSRLPWLGTGSQRGSEERSTVTQNKTFKRRVRARMAKTGESYTAARAQLAKRSAGPSPADYASIAGMSDEAVARKTSKSWTEWVRALDALDAPAMSHREIAAALKDIGYTGSLVMEPFLMPGGEVGRDIRVFRDLRDGVVLDEEAKRAAEFMRGVLA